MEFVGYGIVSAVALAVDAGLLAFLHYVLGVHYLVACSTSFILGGVVAYFLSIGFVFRRRRITNHAVEAPTFILLGLVGLGVNAVVMSLVVDNLGATVMIAKGCAAGVTFSVNFVLRKLVLFSARGPAGATAIPQEPT
jgi:putative flippase GtrA